jgi:hypothetical protein
MFDQIKDAQYQVTQMSHTAHILRYNGSVPEG